MGVLTYLEMKDYVELQFGNNTAWSTPTDYYGAWVNRAYIRLTTQDRLLGVDKRFYFPQLETSGTDDTADGTTYIEVPSDALIVRDVYDTENYRRLTNITHRTYVGYTDRADTSKEGEPTEWVRQGSYIYLYPTPDGAYTMQIYYRKIPAIMSLDAAVTAIGAEWDEPIVTLAAYIGKLWTMDYEKADYLREEFKEQAAGVLTIYGEEEKARDEYLHLDPVYRDGSY